MVRRINYFIILCMAIFATILLAGCEFGNVKSADAKDIAADFIKNKYGVRATALDAKSDYKVSSFLE